MAEAISGSAVNGQRLSKSHQLGACLLAWLIRSQSAPSPPVRSSTDRPRDDDLWGRSAFSVVSFPDRDRRRLAWISMASPRTMATDLRR
jgi:hypothetical protein